MRLHHKFFALLLAFALMGASFATTEDDGTDDDNYVYVLNGIYTTDPSTNSQVTALYNGFKAALYGTRAKVADGRTIKLVDIDHSVDISDFSAVVAKAVETYPNLLTVVGPYSDTRLVMAMMSGVLVKNNLVCIGPFTGSSAIRGYNQMNYFTRAEPAIELLVLLDYALNKMRYRRLAFMYISNASFGDEEYELLQSQLDSMGREPAASYIDLYNSTAPLNQTAFDEMAATNPQAIFIWGFPGMQLVQFISRVLTDPRTADAVLLVPSPDQEYVYSVYNSLVAAGAIKNRDNQIVSSGTNMLPTDTTTQHIALFRQEMDEYIASGEGNYSSSSDYMDDLVVGETLVAGWLVGKVLWETLQHSNWVTDRVSYRNGLFSQNRYVIGGDFVIGDYGGACTSYEASLGAMCNCNQGGHTAFLKTMVDQTPTMVLDATLTYPVTLCRATSYSLERPVNVGIFDFTDVQKLHNSATLIQTMVPLYTANTELSDVSMNVATMPTTSSNAQSALNAQIQDHTLEAMMGAMVADVEVSSILVVAPTFSKPVATVDRGNYIYISPTMEQQIFTLYDYLNASRSTNLKVNVVMRGLESDSVSWLRSVFASTAATFNTEEPTVRVISDDDDLMQALASDKINHVFGIKTDDAPTVADYLKKNTNAYILMSSIDFNLNYLSLASAFTSQDPSVQRRLLDITNLPLWSDTSDAAHKASPLLALFHKSVTDPSIQGPGALQAFFNVAFLGSLLTTTSTISAAELQATVYRMNIVTVQGVSLGPFSWGCSDSNYASLNVSEVATTSGQCKHVNYGARDLSLISMERALNPSVAPLADNLNPSMVYTPRPEKDKKLSKGQLAGIIVGSVLGGLLLIAAIILLVYCCCGRGNRDNSSAPRSSKDPVTLIFTDIESSTALWAALPQIMPEAVATHHRIIRQLIAKHKCYEVKTIGDSFMIACKDAHAGVQLAADIQTRLLKHDWKSSDIDTAYRSFEMKKEESAEVGGYRAPTAHLSPDTYNVLWNGLRVRIGVHTGLSDIRHDEVTKGYDYYGDTSNMAARTEAVANGGQVLLTESTWWALSDEERDTLAFTNMGPQGLRGVPYAVEMYQLNPVEGREHAALRTEIEAILPDDGDASAQSQGTEMLLSSAGTMTGAAAGIAAVLTGCFSPYPVTQRTRELQPLLSKWHVPVPPRTKQVSEEDYCQGLINRLAVRMSTVLEARKRMNDGHVPDRSGTMSFSQPNPLSALPQRFSTAPSAAQSGLESSRAHQEGSHLVVDVTAGAAQASKGLSEKEVHAIKTSGARPAAKTENPLNEDMVHAFTYEDEDPEELDRTVTEVQVRMPDYLVEKHKAQGRM